MLPFPLATSRLSVGIFAPINIVVDIRVPAVIDIYVSAAAMPVTPAPSITPRCTDGNTGCEGKRRPCNISRWIIVVRWIGRVRPCPVYYGWVIRRYIYNLGVCGFNNDRFFLNHNLLLACCFQVT